MNWEPWEWYKDMAPIKLDIQEPPCKKCKYWKPRVITNNRGEFDGVVFCVAEDMCHDFSCYKVGD